MSGPLPITNDIKARFIERKWMRAAKAWRCFLEIPNDQNIPEVLTALIDSQVQATITGIVSIEISPAFIVDVPSKKKQFQVVLETVYENQASLGPRLTALTDTHVTLSILPLTKTCPALPQAAEPNPDSIDEAKIRGLHISFFQNPKFWQWLSEKTGQIIGNPQDCKTAFKEMLQVASCKDIRTEQLCQAISEFNKRLAGGGSA